MGAWMNAKVVPLPTHDVADVSGALRNLADFIDAGKFGDAHNVAWVIDCGHARIEVGLIGHCGEVAPTLHYLLTLGAREVLKAADPE